MIGKAFILIGIFLLILAVITLFIQPAYFLVLLIAGLLFIVIGICVFAKHKN